MRIKLAPAIRRGPRRAVLARWGDLSHSSAKGAPHGDLSHQLASANPLIPDNLATNPLSGVVCGNHPTVTRTFRSTSPQDTGGRGEGYLPEFALTPRNPTVRTPSDSSGSPIYQPEPIPYPGSNRSPFAGISWNQMPGEGGIPGRPCPVPRVFRRAIPAIDLAAVLRRNE